MENQLLRQLEKRHLLSQVLIKGVDVCTISHRSPLLLYLHRCV